MLLLRKLVPCTSNVPSNEWTMNGGGWGFCRNLRDWSGNFSRIAAFCGRAMFIRDQLRTVKKRKILRIPV